MKNPINNFFTKASELILSPIAKNPVFFVWQLVLMCLPVIITGFTSGLNYKGVIMEILPYFHIYLFDTFMFCLVLLYLSKFLSENLVKTILYIFSVGMMIFDSFVGIFYQTRISPIIIRLIRETNLEEISGFITTLNSPYFIYLSIGIILICVSICVTEKNFHKLHKPVLKSINDNYSGGGTSLIFKYLITIITAVICAYNVSRDTIIGITYISSTLVSHKNWGLVKH